MTGMKLGQYVYGDSLIHQLDPRTKIICCTLAVISVMASVNLYYLFSLLLLMVATIIFSRLSLKFILKNIWQIKTLLLITLLFQAFLTPGQAVLTIGTISMTREGLILGSINILRLIILFMGSLILLMTTTPMKLSTGIEYFLQPLGKMNMPVHNFTTILSISFRFLPTLFEEATIIRNAQKSRGSQFDSPELMVKIKSYAAVVIPLFEASLSRAADLGEAMDSRCYTSHPNQLRMNSLKMKGRDVLALLFVSVIVLAGVPVSILMK
ncbi:MAG TPA: energy-coupling factor transporter transmembrane protein EcfT [Syntrophomonas sp.]|nr:energy-coupling factor transporter transmembrane protein EcfT [Syntrophomonas sp.]